MIFLLRAPWPRWVLDSASGLTLCEEAEAAAGPVDKTLGTLDVVHLDTREPVNGGSRQGSKT